MSGASPLIEQMQPDSNGAARNRVENAVMFAHAGANAPRSVAHIVRRALMAKGGPVWHLLLVLMVLAGVMMDAEAAYRKRIVLYGFGYELMNARETELLDCKYGEVNVGLGPGSCKTGSAPLADVLYVKWRDRTTGQVYEERVDIERRLPPRRKMHGSMVYWLIEDNQLYVYLIPDGGNQYHPLNLRPPDQPRNGPARYSYLDVKTLYPDNAPPRVHGFTPQMEAAIEAGRAEVAARKAAEESARREAAERGECVFIDEVLGICTPVRQRRQRP